MQWLTAINMNGVPGRSRTCNLLIRSQVLYPIELRVRWERAGTISGDCAGRQPEFCGVEPEKAMERKVDDRQMHAMVFELYPSVLGSVCRRLNPQPFPFPLNQRQ